MNAKTSMQSIEDCKTIGEVMDLDQGISKLEIGNTKVILLTEYNNSPKSRGGVVDIAYPNNTALMCRPLSWTPYAEKLVEGLE